jgi:hypothetical protein
MNCGSDFANFFLTCVAFFILFIRPIRMIFISDSPLSVSFHLSPFCDLFLISPEFASKIDTNSSMRSHRRMFSPEDDEELRNLVTTFGESSWTDIAIRMPLGFTSRQCRERWRNYVSPSLHRQSWTDEDDRKLIDAFAGFGTRWTRIAEAFPGRSGNTVRNRYFLLQRKKDRQQQGTNLCQSERAEAATGPSWFSPGSLADFEQGSFVSIIFPPN